MKLAFIDRREELKRLRQRLSGEESSFLCLYGRRRCGKSRLLQEAMRKRRAVYYVGDERESSLQRRSLARAVAEIIPGFDRVEYPDWDALLERWWREAPGGSVLALDEFPFLVAAGPVLPSLLQKRIDSNRQPPVHVIVCGSSQRMMQGLVLSASAPLYGRAKEILKM